MSEVLVTVFHQGTVISMARSGKHSESVFGGPFEGTVSTNGGLRKPLHHVATISRAEVKALEALWVWEVPLIYGFSYSGCELIYTFEQSNSVVESLQPGEPEEGWPYPHYPELLPYIPLEVCCIRQESWEAFRRSVRNLPSQQPTEMVVLVPPPATIGQSLWGRTGDAEGVTVVFECSLSNKRIHAYNVCS
jgi:hypothetical protein